VILLIGFLIGSISSAHAVDLHAQERRVQIMDARVEELRLGLNGRMEKIEQSYFSDMLRLAELEAAVYGPRFEDPWHSFPPPNRYPPERRKQVHGGDLAYCRLEVIAPIPAEPVPGVGLKAY